MAICDAWNDHTAHLRQCGSGSHGEETPEDLPDSTTVAMVESTGEELVPPSTEARGAFIISYACFVLEALGRGIAGGWRTEVRYDHMQAIAAMVPILCSLLLCQSHKTF